MTDVSIERYGKSIVLTAPYVLKDWAKEVPGARYDPKTRSWKYPLTYAHCVMLRGVFAERLQIGPKLSEWATKEVERRIAPAMKAREERTWTPDNT